MNESRYLGREVFLQVHGLLVVQEAVPSLAHHLSQLVGRSSHQHAVHAVGYHLEDGGDEEGVRGMCVSGY